MNRKSIALVVVASALLGVSVFAADAPATNSAEADEIAALKQEIQALEQKVDALERQQHAATNSTSSSQVEALNEKVQAFEHERTEDRYEAEQLAKTEPKVTLSQNGFSFGSADSNFVAQLHGVLQVDSRSFFQDGGNNGTDGFLLRRARPILTGTVFRDFDFNFTPDFGGNTVQIFDAFLNYHYNSAFQLEAGKFKSPIGLEELVADRDLLFNERSLVTDLVPNRDIGVQLQGDVFAVAQSITRWAWSTATPITTPPP